MEATPRGCVASTRVVRIEGGRLRLGPGDWEAQGVVVPRDVELPAFGIDAIEATDEAWSACVSLGACPALPLSGEPGRSMRGVTAKEAAGFCDHRGGALPSSDQLAFAAMGSAGRRYPWGDTGAVCRRAAWGLASGPCGWDGTGPELAGSHPDGASRDGVEDLAGNVAEWAIDPSGRAELRGGSFRSAAASDLRGWQRRVVEDGARPDDAGVRCVFP
jgi:formylglycine-generating enzyme required for sulfatase activity